MPLFNQTVLTTAYLPPIEYFFAIAQSGKVLIEQHEFYQKQSYRNRCVIYSAGGPEALSIPVIKESGLSRPIRDIRIDYTDPWLQHHIRAFSAAYNSSPFYLYYQDEIIALLNRKREFLFDLNTEMLMLLLDMVGLKADISFTDEFVPQWPESDFRERIHPKYKGESLMSEQKKEKTYYQVFSNKLGFVPNLSVLDLLSNEGPNSISFLL